MFLLDELLSTMEIKNKKCVIQMCYKWQMCYIDFSISVIQNIVPVFDLCLLTDVFE